MELDTIIRLINSLVAPEQLREVVKVSQKCLERVVQERMISAFSTEDVQCVRHFSDGTGDEYPGCRSSNGDILQEHTLVFQRGGIFVKVLLVYTKECDGFCDPWYRMNIRVNGEGVITPIYAAWKRCKEFFPIFLTPEYHEEEQENDEEEEEEEEFIEDTPALSDIIEEMSVPPPDFEQALGAHYPFVKECLGVILKNRNELDFHE